MYICVSSHTQHTLCPTGMFRISIIRVIKPNELDGTCGTYTGEEKYGQGFDGGNQRQRDHLDDVGVDRISRRGEGAMD